MIEAETWTVLIKGEKTRNTCINDNMKRRFFSRWEEEVLGYF